MKEDESSQRLDARLSTLQEVNAIMDNTCCKAGRLQPLDGKDESSPSPLDLGLGLTDDEILAVQTSNNFIQELASTYDQSASCINENHVCEDLSGYPPTMS